MAQNKLGTKEDFRSWLLEVKRINYTRYSQLPTDRKLAIQKEYNSDARQTSKSTVIVVEEKKDETASA